MGSQLAVEPVAVAAEHSTEGKQPVAVAGGLVDRAAVVLGLVVPAVEVHTQLVVYAAYRMVAEAAGL